MKKPRSTCGRLCALPFFLFIVFWACGLCAAAQTASSRTERSPHPTGTHKILFMPMWTPQAQFAGYIMAQEKGFYAKAGLDVEMSYATTLEEAEKKRLGGERTTIFLTHLVQALIARSQGQDWLNVAQTSQKSGQVLCAQPHVTSLDQLMNSRVGIWHTGFSEVVKCMAEDRKATPEWVEILSGVNYYVRGAVEAMLTEYYNEYFSVTNCGKRVTSQNTFHLADYGYDVPEDGIYCSAAVYRNHSKEVDAFVAASIEGWKYAASHKEETIEVVLRVMAEHNIAGGKTHQQWMLDKVLELQVNGKTNHAGFTLDPEAFRFTNDLLLRHGYIQNGIKYEDFVESRHRWKN